MDALPVRESVSSPYQSDSETNPNISNLTITNPAATVHDVRLAYQVVNTQGQMLASGEHQ